MCQYRGHKKRSLSEPTVKQRLSSKSLFSNLFSRKKVNFVGKSWHLIFFSSKKSESEAEVKSKDDYGVPRNVAPNDDIGEKIDCM